MCVIEHHGTPWWIIRENNNWNRSTAQSVTSCWTFLQRSKVKKSQQTFQKHLQELCICLCVGWCEMKHIQSLHRFILKPLSETKPVSSSYITNPATPPILRTNFALHFVVTNSLSACFDWKPSALANIAVLQYNEPFLLDFRWESGTYTKSTTGESGERLQDVCRMNRSIHYQTMLQPSVFIGWLPASTYSTDWETNSL